jgi:nicotinate-nucleotide--dimethylbenzimidazole phosphoribosyltransferase
MKNLEELINQIQLPNQKTMALAQARLDSLTKPKGSLGRLEEFVVQLAGVTSNPMPDISKKTLFLFAGDHGVVEEGVSAFPKEVTRQMIVNFINGGAAINALARHAQADVVVIDIGVDYDFQERQGLLSRKVVYGVGNITKTQAMTHEQAVQSIMVGVDLALEYAQRGCRLFATGDMGIGNTTPSTAIAAIITRRPVRELTGRGTGINDGAMERKIAVIEKVLALHRPNPNDGIDILAKVGGAEIGGIAGLILGAAFTQTPTVIDGFISTAGALIAYLLAPKAVNYLFAAHCSAESGHRAMLERLGLNPILDLQMRLGEGTGAALAMTLLDAAVKVYKEMATFEQAHVSECV